MAVHGSAVNSSDLLPGSARACKGNGSREVLRACAWVRGPGLGPPTGRILVVVDHVNREILRLMVTSPVTLRVRLAGLVARLRPRLRQWGHGRGAAARAGRELVSASTTTTTLGPVGHAVGPQRQGEEGIGVERQREVDRSTVITIMRSRRRQREMLALMCADVLIEDGLLAKTLPTLRALERLLTRVDAQVLVEYGALPERALAVDARERLLVGVDAQVLREVRLLAEPLAALGAAVRPAVRVDALVL